MLLWFMALDFENLTPKQSVALAFGGLVLISGAVFGAQIVKERHAAKMLEIKIADNAKDASICIDKKAVTDVCDRVDKDLLDGDLLVAFENISVKRQQLLDKAEADRKAALARMEAEERARKARVAAQNVAAAKKRAAAEARFKAEGWWEQEPGVFLRWCTKTCSTADVIGDASYWLMEVWCRDRACGDVYAQMNILRGGTAVGWTNDTMYLGYGQKGVLTFQKYGLPGGGASYKGRLVKFSARG